MLPALTRKGKAGIAVGVGGLLAVVSLLAWQAWDRTDHGAAGPASPEPGKVELCGFGSTKPIRTTSDYPPEVIRAAEHAFSSVAASLAAQSPPQTQAVGLYAKLVAAMRRAGEEDQRLHPDCVDAPCVQRRWKVAKEAAGPPAQELARLALASQGPVAYALALVGCQLNRDDGTCAQLSLARWSQLEPDNAVPWLHLIGETAARKDEVALSAALLQAARAKTSDAHWSLVLTMAEHPAARKLAEAPRLVYLSQLLGVYAAFPTPPYAAVSEACATDRMADPARRQACLDLATTLTERSSSLLEFSLGTVIGERGGWPPERVRRLREEAEAIYFVGQLDWVADDVHSCGFLERLEARTKELSTMGELPAARRKLAASDRPVAALAQDWRELQRRRSSAPGQATGPK